MTRHENAGKRRKYVTRAGQELAFTALGFGSAPLGNYLRSLSEAECDRTLDCAWEFGLRYFDTAPLYGFGLSESRVGRNLQKQDRAEYILSTKVGRLLEPCDPADVNSGFFVDTPNVRFRYDYSYDGVMRSYQESLERLGGGYADILFVHDIDSFAHGNTEGCEERFRELIDGGGWRALTELRNSGDVKALGLGVNEWQPCARLLNLADPDLFLLAGRYTLLEQEPLESLFPQCDRRGVGIVIGGPYNSGVLAGRSTFNYGEIPPDVTDRVNRLERVCHVHDVPLPAAALQFVLAHPLVVSVIPGSQSPEEMKQNVALLDVEIPRALWDEMKERKLLHPDSPTPG